MRSKLALPQLKTAFILWASHIYFIRSFGQPYFPVSLFTFIYPSSPTCHFVYVFFVLSVLYLEFHIIFSPKVQIYGIPVEIICISSTYSLYSCQVPPVKNLASGLPGPNFLSAFLNYCSVT